MTSPGNKLRLYQVPVFFTILLFNIIKSSFVYAVFADFRTFLAALLCRLVRKKLIVVVGGYETAHVPELNYGGLLTWWGKYKARYILTKAAAVFALSEFSKKEIEEFIPRNDIIINYPAVLFSVFPESGKRDQKVVMIADLINRFYPVYKLKGIETYVLAAREIDHPCYLVGSYDPALKQEMLKLNSDIIFTGKLNHNDLMKLLLSSRVYCQLSFRESFGIALAEAIACGCNPVVTDNGALPEVAGDLAEYVDYGDVPGTVLAIRKALTKELPAQDIIMIRNRFSLSAHEQILVSTLRGINVL